MDTFTHILWGWFIGIGSVVGVPRGQLINPKGYRAGGITKRLQNTTKHETCAYMSNVVSVAYVKGMGK